MRYTTNDRSVVAVGPAPLLPPSARRLGTKDNLSWGSIPLSELHQLLAQRALGIPFLLFLSEAQYQEAVQGLNEEQTLEVVHHRINKPALYLADMVEDLGEEFGKLGAIADTLSQNASNRHRARAWQEITLWSLAAHRTAYMLGRFVEGNTNDISRMIQWRTTLLSLEKELMSMTTDSPELQSSSRAAVVAYETTFRELAEVDKELGEPAYTIAPARDYQARLVFVSKDHPFIAPRVARGDVPAIEWNEEILVPLTPDEIIKVSKLYKPVTLYLSMEEYNWATTRLTSAQIERDLRARYDAGGPTVTQILERILTLRLAFLAHLGALIEEAKQLPLFNERLLALLSTTQMRELRLLPGLLQGEPDHLSEVNIEVMREVFSQMRLKLHIMHYFCLAQNETELVIWIDNARVLVDNIMDALTHMRP